MTNYGRPGSVKSQSEKILCHTLALYYTEKQRRHLDKDWRHAHAEHGSLKQHGGM